MRAYLLALASFVTACGIRSGSSEPWTRAKVMSTPAKILHNSGFEELDATGWIAGDWENHDSNPNGAIVES